jgi:hypothetical protein
MDELETGSMLGEINAIATHEGRHFSPQNLRIKSYPDYEIDAYKVEEATRKQWLATYGKNASVLPPSPLSTKWKKEMRLLILFSILLVFGVASYCAAQTKGDTAVIARRLQLKEEELRINVTIYLPIIKRWIVSD